MLCVPHGEPPNQPRQKAPGRRTVWRSIGPPKGADKKGGPKQLLHKRFKKGKKKNQSHRAGQREYRKKSFQSKKLTTSWRLKRKWGAVKTVERKKFHQKLTLKLPLTTRRGGSRPAKKYYQKPTPPGRGINKKFSKEFDCRLKERTLGLFETSPRKRPEPV